MCVEDTINAQKISLWRVVDNVESKVIGIDDLPLLATSWAPIKTTTLDDDYECSEGGSIISIGALDVKGLISAGDVVQHALHADHLAQVKRQYRIKLPDGTIAYEFYAHITKWTPAAKIGDKLRLSFGLDITGKPTINAL